jgi:hypothetical protein
LEKGCEVGLTMDSGLVVLMVVTKVLWMVSQLVALTVALTDRKKVEKLEMR